MLCASGVISLSSGLAQDNRTSFDDAIKGSVYPTDVVASLEGAERSLSGPDETAEAKFDQVTVENPDLARALGPALAVLQTNNSQPAFRSLIRTAIGRHPAYHTQIASLEAGEAGKKRARSALYPQISSQFSGDYVITRDFDADTDNVVESLRPREQFTVGVSASQLVYDGGATFQRIKSARARQSEFRNAISTRINDLAFEALTTYHDLLTHKALVALGNGIVQRHEEILSDVKEREKLGAGSRADVTRAYARLAAARARVSEIRESERLAEVRYIDFFEREPDQLARPDYAALGVKTREDAIGAALQNNPELSVAEAQSAASTADYKAAKGERLPQVRLSVDAVKFDVFDSGDDFDVRAGVNVQYNIFGGGARAANISESASLARQARFNEDQIRREITRDAAFAYERSVGASRRLRALEAAVVAHNQTRDLVLERYRFARGDLIDVLQAENDYFEAAVAYVTGLTTRDLSRYALMEHTGDLLRFFSPTEEYADLLAGDFDG
ncbi:MAG: TolC family protein [Pseudomonadota bacterium]